MLTMTSVLSAAHLCQASIAERVYSFGGIPAPDTDHIMKFSMPMHQPHAVASVHLVTRATRL